jgi:hypothetical protein
MSGMITGATAPATGGGALSALAPVIMPLMALPTPAARVARLVPGLHW